MIWRMFGLLVLGIVLLGCQTLAPKPEGEKPSASELLGSVMQQAGAIASVQVEGALELKMPPAKHQRGDVYVVVERPDKLTLEITGPPGLIVALTADGEQFRYYAPSDKQILYGPVMPETVVQVLPWMIMPEDLAPILCGAPRLIAATHKRLDWDAELARWRLTLLDKVGGRAQSWWFNADKSLYRVTERKATGELDWEITYLGWEPRGAEKILFPGYFKVFYAQNQAQITLRLSGQPRFNQPIDPETFRLPLVDGLPALEVKPPPGRLP